MTLNQHIEKLCALRDSIEGAGEFAVHITGCFGADEQLDDHTKIILNLNEGKVEIETGLTP